MNFLNFLILQVFNGPHEPREEQGLYALLARTLQPLFGTAPI